MRQDVVEVSVTGTGVVPTTSSGGGAVLDDATTVVVDAAVVVDGATVVVGSATVVVAAGAVEVIGSALLGRAATNAPTPKPATVPNAMMRPAPERIRLRRRSRW